MAAELDEIISLIPWALKKVPANRFGRVTDVLRYLVYGGLEIVFPVQLQKLVQVGVLCV
jgi:hypothetical protein